MSLTIITGDDITVLVQLKKNEAPFVIDNGATVQGAIRSGSGILGNTIACANTDVGANWPASLVAIPFTSTDTALLPELSSGSGQLEVQVDDGGKTTWIVKGVTVLKGFIA